MLSGEIQFLCSGEAYLCQPGTLVHIPRGTAHGFQYGKGGGQMLEITEKTPGPPRCLPPSIKQAYQDRQTFRIFCRCSSRTGSPLPLRPKGARMEGYVEVVLLAQNAKCRPSRATSASLIGRLRSSAFRPSTSTVSMSLAGPCFSSESAPGPFHHGFRGRGGTKHAGRPCRLTDSRSKQTYELAFSNRPIEVKRFQTIHQHSVDVARGAVLLFGIRRQGPSIMGFEDGAEQSVGRPCRLTDSRSKQTYELAFSNRPIGVKRFQTIHQHSVDVARGAVLLFGIGARALPSWVSRTGRNNLLGGLAVLQTAGPSRHTNSPHPSSRKGHHSTASVELECPPILLDPV